MAEALTVYESARTQHGVLRSLAEDADTDGWWNVRPVTDYAAQAVARHRDDNDVKPYERLEVTLDPKYQRRTPSASTDDQPDES